MALLRTTPSQLMQTKKKTETKKEKKGTVFQKLNVGAETISPGASKFENFTLL